MAQSIGADFVTLSPVLPTPSHPGARSMGWAQFRVLSDRTSIPVYAFGGVAADQLALACERGAQGVAGIRTYWPDIE
jgi:8-oxo-dGTP diphosphatase